MFSLTLSFRLVTCPASAPSEVVAVEVAVAEIATTAANQVTSRATAPNRGRAEAEAGVVAECSATSAKVMFLCR